MKPETRGPLGRTELNAMGCSTPNCSHDHSTIFLHANCHPSAGTRVVYVKQGGFLVIECAECEDTVGAIWAGDGPPKDKTN